MIETILDVREYKNRKQKYCSICSRVIPPGEWITREVWTVDDGIRQRAEYYCGNCVKPKQKGDTFSPP